MSGEEKAQRAPSLLSVSAPLSPLRSERGLLPTPEGADPPLADRMGESLPSISMSGLSRSRVPGEDWVGPAGSVPTRCEQLTAGSDCGSASASTNNCSNTSERRIAAPLTPSRGMPPDRGVAHCLGKWPAVNHRASIKTCDTIDHPISTLPTRASGFSSVRERGINFSTLKHEIPRCQMKPNPVGQLASAPRGCRESSSKK